VTKGVGINEQTWRLPSVTVIAQEASSLKGKSNQVLPKASAIVSCRIVPDQDPEEVSRQLQEFLTKDPPWGVKVTVTPGTGLLNESRTRACNAVGKFVLTVALWGLPPLDTMLAGAPGQQRLPDHLIEKCARIKMIARG